MVSLCACSLGDAVTANRAAGDVPAREIEPERVDGGRAGILATPGERDQACRVVAEEVLAGEVFEHRRAGVVEANAAVIAGVGRQSGRRVTKRERPRIGRPRLARGHAVGKRRIPGVDVRGVIRRPAVRRHQHLQRRIRGRDDVQEVDQILVVGAADAGREVERGRRGRRVGLQQHQAAALRTRKHTR